MQRLVWRAGLVAPATIWLFLLSFLPLVIVARQAFASRTTYGNIAWTWTLANFQQALEPIYLAIYWRSLWMAAVVTVVCILLSYPVAIFLAFYVSARWKPFLMTLTVVPLWTSLVVRTFAWTHLLRTEGVINTALLNWGLIREPLPLLYNNLAVFIGLVAGELPFMIIPLLSSLDKLDRRWLDAAADLGATPWATFWNVVFPLARPGLMTGSILVFVPSLGNFVVADLLGGARSILLGNVIWNQFFQRNQPFGSAITLLLIGSVSIAVFVAARMRHAHAPRQEQ
ncbi:MAG: ABC transporter permease [Chloracidobacterium sp.]|uniref:ABC transporter permease n=1 Tax=Chloracidobacterium validum TaxID=2821543 RepID=A0ABX8B9G5_9BACT|nr:ABC transporter permease [Chloracidobacterium validum]QUW03582.1 ABC transporter permease [Chloracidobacterium validum]